MGGGLVVADDRLHPQFGLRLFGVVVLQDDAAADGLSLLYGPVLLPEYRDAPLDAIKLR